MSCSSTSTLLFIIHFVLGSTAPGQQVNNVELPRAAPVNKGASVAQEIIQISCGESVQGPVQYDTTGDLLLLLKFTLEERMMVALDGCKSEFDVEFYVSNDLGLTSSSESSQVFSGACDVAKLYQEVQQGSYYVGVKAPTAGRGSNYAITLMCDRPPMLAEDSALASEMGANGADMGATVNSPSPSPVVCGQTFSGSTVNAPNHFTGQVAGDAIFKISITQPTTVTFNGCASSFDTYFYLTNSAWSVVASNDDSGCGFQSMLQATLTTSGTYYFVVDGYATTTGAYSVTLTCSAAAATTSSPSPTRSIPAPSRSKSPTPTSTVSSSPSKGAVPTPSSSRSPVPSVSQTPSVSKVVTSPSASPSPSPSFVAGPFSTTTAISCGQTFSGSTVGAVSHYAGQPAGDAVFSFSVAGPTTVSFNGCASGYDTYFYLINSAGNVVASNDDSSCGSQSVLQTTLSASGTYYLVVDGFYLTTGTYSVTFTCPSPTPTPIATPTPTPSVSPALTYHGGSLMLGQVSVYLIYYGSWTNTYASTFQSYTRFFAQHVSQTPWYNIITAYSDAQGNHISPNVVLAGEIVDNYSVGTTVQSSNLYTIVQNALQHFPASSNAIYFVIPSADVSVPGMCTSWCGYHTWNPSTNIRFALVPDATSCGYRCGVASSGPSLSGNYAADAFMSVFAHELVETVTDPLGSGYYDNTGAENADKCAWTFGSQYFTPSGAVANMNIVDSASGEAMDFKIQQNWVLPQGSDTGHCGMSL